MADFPKHFHYGMIMSTISLKNTSTDRKMSDVLLSEFVPINDIYDGQGVDEKQVGTKFYNWDQLLD